VRKGRGRDRKQQRKGGKRRGEEGKRLVRLRERVDSYR